MRIRGRVKIKFKTRNVIVLFFISRMTMGSDLLLFLFKRRSSGRIKTNSKIRNIVIFILETFPSCDLLFLRMMRIRGRVKIKSKTRNVIVLLFISRMTLGSDLLLFLFKTRRWRGFGMGCRKV
nr:hypothetical protein Iba_chr12fCG3170 [Ipomoea batatas]